MATLADVIHRVLLTVLLLATTAEAQERPVPYWASIAAGQAAMRTGPGKEYPVSWLYRRRDLPLRVVQVHDAWRRVVEPDGTTGWMLAQLLAARRTVIVLPGGLADIRDQPSADGRLLWRAEPGVVGRISHCAGGWCRIQLDARVGYVEVARLWGVAPGETVD